MSEVGNGLAIPLWGLVIENMPEIACKVIILCHALMLVHTQGKSCCGIPMWNPHVESPSRITVAQNQAQASNPSRQKVSS